MLLTLVDSGKYAHYLNRCLVGRMPPVTLMVSRQYPYIGGQWKKCSRTPVASGKNASCNIDGQQTQYPYIGGQWKKWPHTLVTSGENDSTYNGRKKNAAPFTLVVQWKEYPLQWWSMGRIHELEW